MIKWICTLNTLFSFCAQKTTVLPMLRSELVFRDIMNKANTPNIQRKLISNAGACKNRTKFISINSVIKFVHIHLNSRRHQKIHRNLAI